jgi:small-conductance mechanosensitive channel
MKRALRSVLLLTALAGTLAVAGCGGSDAEAEDESATPAQAAQEIDQIETLLDDALAQYRDGDAEAAEETVGDAYLEHFEKVEGPLGDEDHEFMDELEHRISTEIRDEMKDDAPVAEVEQLIGQTKQDLAKAQAMLQGS